ncbi:VaFE repeat-containing surface-anchored protein, partial [Corynebacterium sp. MSK218]|nr:VaFE repeat-containing surface-anchored protein [Corynebacterium sp. MSK218]
MVFTAVLTAIAVIAAMIAVPWMKAEAVEGDPTSFKPDFELGGAPNTTNAKEWGSLTWAGPNISGVKANPNNNVGWAWCIDPMKHYPVTSVSTLYAKDNATKLDIAPEYRDAVIRLALKWQEALRNGDKSKAATYVVYMTALVGRDPIDRTTAAYTINEQQPRYSNPDGDVNFPAYKGSMEEFTELTGLKIESAENPGTNKTGAGPKFVKVADIPKQPDNYYITVVLPKGGASRGAQRVIPPDQPGLPDGGGDNPGTEETPESSTTEETTPEETPSESSETETTSEEPTTEETTEPSEPSTTDEETTEETTSKETPSEATDESTTEETEEPSTTPNTDVVPEPTPSSSERPEPQTPSIKTVAEFAEGSSRVVNGATVIDTVTYEGLVAGKKYHLDAQLMSKDGQTVLGDGSADFVAAEGGSGSTTVEITVKNAEKPVDAAVAFEELTSVEVNADGDETPGVETPNKIAEHKDLKDEAQTVTSKETLTPSIKTVAEFAEGSSRVVNGATVIDTVTYEGLVAGKKYHLDAQLMSKDGQTVLGDGSADFVAAEGGSGSTTVEITVKNAEKPVEAAVAFEELTSVEVNDKGEETPGVTSEKPNHIAEHKDIDDENQTVPKPGEETTPNKPGEETTPETTEPSEPSESTTPREPGEESDKPKISTNADFANGATEVVAGAQVNDTVTYEGLVPGKEYTLFAELISKEDGKSVLGKGKTTFTPDAADGEVVVEIIVDESVTEPVEAAVAFEELTSVEVNDKGEETPG